MPPPPLIIVTGPPASGKTNLARRLAADLRLPLLSRDELKEQLFDSLGWDDRAWSRRLGAASYDLLWLVLERHLAAGNALVVESNFRGEQTTARFRDLAARHPFTPYQINCHTDGATLLRRHAARARSGERHPGHVDDRDDPELRAELARGRIDPFPIGGTLIEVDTTDFSAVDFAGILRRLRGALDGRADAGPGGFRLARLDHLVLTVADLEATRDWYARALGMTPITFDQGRLALGFGDQRINLHQRGREFEPKSAHPTPGSGDLCFTTATPLAEVVAHLDAVGVPIELGPVPRAGARGRLLSVYLRDPDDNLIEIANELPEGEEEAR